MYEVENSFGQINHVKSVELEQHEKPVRAALGELASAVAHNDDLLGKLSSELDFVLSPAVPRPEAGKPTVDPVCSPMHSSVMKLYRHVSANNARLRDLIDRLAV